MKRDYRFDVVRVLCMSYIVVYAHLYAYVHPNVISALVVYPAHFVLANSCLGLFTFTSGYLIGVKYCFTNKWGGVVQFYKKRLLRIIPLFVLAALVLYLIGFNRGRATLNGLICVSPFIKPRPLTLWYIPVILICYLITPFISRKTFLWRILSASVIVAILVLLRLNIKSIDWRFGFNVLFYLVGLVSAPYFDWKFKKTPIIKWLIIVVFILLLFFVQLLKPDELYRRYFAGVGVFAILFFSDIFADLAFNKEGVVSKTIINISYASMVCYMFHRFFFWCGEMLWNPTQQWVKWLYMSVIVFPIMLILSYQIQKGYDSLINNFNKHK